MGHVAVCIGLLGMSGKVAWRADTISYNRVSVRAKGGHVADGIGLLGMTGKVVCKAGATSYSQGPSGV